MEPQKPLKLALNPCCRPYSTLKSTMNPHRSHMQDGYSAPLKTSHGTVEQWTSRSIGKPGEEVVHCISDPPADQTSHSHGCCNGDDHRGGGNDGSADSGSRYRAAEGRRRRSGQPRADGRVSTGSLALVPRCHAVTAKFVCPLNVMSNIDNLR